MMDPYTQEGHTYRFRLTVQDLAVFLVKLAFSNKRVGMWSGFVLRKWSLALGWPPSIKSLANPRVHVRPHQN